MRKYLLLAGAIFFGLSVWAFAQVVPQPGPPTPAACAYSTTPVTLTDGQAGWVQCDSSGKLQVNSANTGTVSIASATTGGCTPGKLLSAASTNSTSIKGSVGTLCKVTAINTTAVVYYLKFYNKATAPTCNSDTVVATYPVPFAASSAGGGISVNLGAFGEAYTLGIGFCLTGGSADNDNTNAATGVTISYSFK